MPQIFIVHDTNVLLSETAYSKSIPEKIVSVWRYGNLNVILYQSISMPKGHGFALTPYKGALVHLCYETLRNKFNFLK